MKLRNKMEKAKIKLIWSRESSVEKSAIQSRGIDEKSTTQNATDRFRISRGTAAPPIGSAH